MLKNQQYKVLECKKDTYNFNSITKYYTGEPVTFTTDEIGVPTVGANSTPLIKVVITESLFR